MKRTLATIAITLGLTAGIVAGTTAVSQARDTTWGCPGCAHAIHHR